MVLVKILKRKDASSVVVAILAAMIIGQALMSTTGRVSGIISGLNGNSGFGYGPGGGWKDQYLFPIVWALVQLIVLEVLAWIYIFAAMPMRRKK